MGLLSAGVAVASLLGARRSARQAGDAALAAEQAGRSARRAVRRMYAERWLEEEALHLIFIVRDALQAGEWVRALRSCESLASGLSSTAEYMAAQEATNVAALAWKLAEGLVSTQGGAQESREHLSQLLQLEQRLAEWRGVLRRAVEDGDAK